MVMYAICCNVLIGKKTRCFAIIIGVTGIWILYLCLTSPYQIYLPEVQSFLGISVQKRMAGSSQEDSATCGDMCGGYHTKTLPYKYNETCTPRVNVTFLKTHKTASCTIQNIFLRYAKEKHRLMLIPMYGNYFGHPQYFTHSMAPPLKPGNAYSILGHHHRWNYPEVRKVMPPNSVYVTILRDPVKVFESLYFYANLSRFYKMEVRDYALANSSYHKHHMQRKNGLGRNQMSFDLGFSDSYFGNGTLVERFFQTIKQQFDLVMISEKMTESLVLMKNLLCWSFDDIVVFHHNERLPQTKANLTEEEKAGLRRWNDVDVRLYKFFSDILQQRIKDFGVERMAREKEELHNTTQAWYDFCVERRDVAGVIPKKFRPYHSKTFGFVLNQNVTNSTCESLIMGELPFTDLLRQSQQMYYHVQKKKAPQRKRKYRRFSQKRF